MLNIENLSRRFENGRGVGPLSFSADPGSVVAVVGPNGAGKTTLFRALAGLDQEVSGSGLLDGVDLFSIPRAQRSFLADEPLLVNGFTLHEMCRFDAAMRNLDIDDDSIGEAIDRLDCGEYANRKISGYSMGMTKRAGIVCAFLGSPDLIILDEPINGLDIQGVILLKQEIERARLRDSIVLISSHILSFLDDIDARILFLKNGLLIMSDFDSGVTSAEDRFLALFGSGRK